MTSTHVICVGTEHGVGVRNAGHMGAAAGELVVRADGRLENTGSIFGDHIAIGVNELINREDGDSAGVIAARERLDMAADTIVNREGAVLLSMGDLAVGGTLDANSHASGKAESVVNESATVEAVGNMHIAAEALYNRNLHLSTERIRVGSERIQEYAITGSSNRYLPSEVSVSSSSVRTLYTPTGQSDNYLHYDYTRYYDTTVVRSSAPGQIMAGGDLVFEGGLLHNKDSRILAGGLLQVSAESLVNEETPGYNYTWDSGTVTNHYRYTPSKLSSAFGSSTRTRTSTAGYNPATIIQEISLGAFAFNDGADNLTLSDSSLFKVNPDATQGYIIETNPLFADYGKWLSSDYMLGKLDLDPTVLMKRVGDGFYEQKLVQEQVAQLTGRRFLEGYSSNEKMYMALLDNGTTFAMQWELRPGVGLTDTQIAQLTSDIVWLVEKEVELPNGELTLALVPQLYLKPREGDLLPSGSLLAANEISLQLAGDMTNQGTVAGREVVAITAENINNIGGRITGDAVQMLAGADINNIGGIIDAINRLDATAAGDINVESTTRSTSSRSGSVTNMDRKAGLYVTGSTDAVLIAMAGNDINVHGAAIVNASESGSTVLAAGNSINLGTVETGQSNTVRWDDRNYRTEGGTTEAGSTIHADGEIMLVANNDINARGAYVSSESGGISLVAGNDINLTASENTIHLDEAHHRKTGGGLLSSKTTTTRDTVNASHAQGSVISGNTVELLASNDITVSGSHVVSTEGTSLTAGNDISIVAATESSHENRFRQEKKSGLFGGGGLGITLGTQVQSNDNNNWAHNASASTVGSIEGDVNMDAGNHYTQTGSHIQALQGDVNITAKKVDITEAQETNLNINEYKFRQSGISVAITSPVISAVQTAAQMNAAQKKTDDGRMKVLAGATTALAAKNAYDAVAEHPKQAGGIGISITLGTSKQDDRTAVSSSAASGSTIVAGNNISITASGDGENSDLTIRGSEISAGNDVTLKADNDIHLLAAANTSEYDRKSSGKSAGVGLAIKIGSQGVGFGFTANASMSKGKGAGDDLAWTNTHVTAGNVLTMESGRDTSLVGAVAKGEQVVADVGRDLTIASLQDMSEYHSKDQNIGGSVTIGIGFAASINVGQQKMDSSYASVTEQSGIKAGDEGFQISVRGNTDLTGAVIASTDKAVEDGRNSLVTGTLTVSDIRNHAEYKASSVNLGGGYTSKGHRLIGHKAADSSGVGQNQQGQSTTGGEIVPGTEQSAYNGWSAGTAIAIGASDSADSTTKSGISEGIISLTDEEKQKELTGQDADTIIASLNRDVSSDRDTTNALKPIFNEEEVKAKMEITIAFAREAGQFITNRAKEVEAYRKAAQDPSLSPEQRAAYQKLADDIEKNWGPGGVYRQVLTAITAAASGNVNNATSQIVQGAVINYVQQQGAFLIGQLQKAGVVDEGSIEHAALHAIVGCAGAASSGASCGAGALGSASSSLLTNLFARLDTAKPTEKDAINNLINNMVVGIASLHLNDGRDISSALAASDAALSNNGLALAAPHVASRVLPFILVGAGMLKTVIDQNAGDNHPEGFPDQTGQWQSGLWVTPEQFEQLRALLGDFIEGAPIFGTNAQELSVPPYPAVCSANPLGCTLFVMMTDTLRPHHTQSEKDVGMGLGENARPQRSFLDGVEVDYGTPGSVRPDWVIDSTYAFEVKNYNLNNISGLIYDISRQAIKNDRHLPEGMKQLFTIDTRGQVLTPEQENRIINRVTEKTGGILMRGDIEFKGD